MSSKRHGELEVAHSKRSNFVMREKQNDRMSVFANYATCSEQPMDLTKKATSGNSSLANGSLSRGNVPPVVSIDSEDESSDDVGREKIIKKLQDELRNEETKLIFLKQLRYNQCKNMLDHAPNSSAHLPHGQTQPAHTPAHMASGRNITNGKPGSVQVNNFQAHSGHVPVRSGPPGQQASAHGQQLGTLQQAKRAGQPALPANSQSRPPFQAHQQVSHGTTAGSSQNVPTPRQNQSASNITSGTSAPPPTPPAPPKPVVLDETQKQSARGALRRQLEKTLLAIPPPKPLPPELSFIPSLISNDFVKLLGLEEVVKMLLDIQRQEKRDVKYVFNPFRCSQCKSDFTPVWKREKPGSKNVICEQCVTSNQKRSLRQEHTARLKNAFLKAAEQQQDLEEQLKKGHIPSSLAAMMPSALQPHGHSTPSSLHGLTSSARSHQQDKTPSSLSSHHRDQREQNRESASSNSYSQNQNTTAAAVAALTGSQSSSSANVNAAAAQLASQLFPQQLTGMSSPSLLGMAYFQQQLAALASQSSNFGLSQAAVAAAAAALNPSQRQSLLDQLTQQAKSYGWKG